MIGKVRHEMNACAQMPVFISESATPRQNQHFRRRVVIAGSKHLLLFPQCVDKSSVSW